MLRLNDQVRLTGPEQERFRQMTDGAAAPRTVAQHDAALDVAIAQVWSGESAEERLMRAVLDGERLSLPQEPSPAANKAG